MITDKKSEGQINNYFGLSSDTKPSACPNASIFYEMDTHAVYMFDAQNSEWLKQNS